MTPEPGGPVAVGEETTAGHRAWVAPMLVAVVTAAAYLPALGNGFVNWDDLQNFVDNPSYRGLGWTQLRWMFTTTHLGPYVPLTWLTLGADYLLWGLDPRGYHLTSVVLHTATALAFYFLGVRLLRLSLGPAARPADLSIGAALAALLFAVHPLRVESVVWITERRDVLSGLLFVLTVIAYVKAVTGSGRRRPWYWSAVGLHAAALLAKSAAAPLPAVLLLLDIWPLRRLGWGVGQRNLGVWLEKIPFLVLSAAASVMAFVGVAQSSSLISLAYMGLTLRLVTTVYGLAFYVEKTLLPMNLSPLYQLPITVTWLHYAAVIGGGLVIVARWRRWPAITVAALAYGITLAPVLGLFQNGPQIVADRYSYLPCLGWALLAGGAAARQRASNRVLRAVLAACIVALALLTAQQSLVWRDSVSLWRHALTISPTSRAAHANLARAHAAQGHPAAAVAEWEETLRLSRNKAPLHAAIGELYEGAGVEGLAADRFREALRLSPGLPEACRGARRLIRPPEHGDGCPALSPPPG
jgi:hypothetical protein